MQIVSLIRSFAIPNTKEDLYDFFVLAKSNIDMEAYDSAKHTLHNDDAQRLISDAWRAQFEQAYQKAVIVFSGDPRLERIKDLYETTQNTLKKVKKRAGKVDTIAGIVVLVFLAIIIGLPIILAPNIEKKENKRLELIETNISIALEDEDYKLALVYADCLKYEGDKASSARNWKIKREYWIDRVIEEANEAGIVLARPKEIEEEQQDQEEQVEEEKQEEQENQDEVVLLPEEERAG